jgi:hypothetical protein
VYVRSCILERVCPLVSSGNARMRGGELYTVFGACMKLRVWESWAPSRWKHEGRADAIRDADGKPLAPLQRARVCVFGLVPSSM